MFSKKIFKKVNYLSASLAKARRKNILIKPLPINISKNLDLVKQIRVASNWFQDWSHKQKNNETVKS